MRGPAFLPRTRPDDLLPGNVPAQRSPAARFDELALEVMRDLWKRFPHDLAGVELGVEEVPLLPDTWATDTVPLATYAEPTGSTPARLVLLRRPIEHRAQTREELTVLVLTVMVEQVAEILGIPPGEVHPDYPGDG